MKQHQSQEGNVPGQIRLAEHGLDTFAGNPAAQRMSDLFQIFYRGIGNFPSDKASWRKAMLALKAEFPEQYRECLSEIRRIRRLQSRAISEFLDERAIQRYPVFIPTWLDGRKWYERERHNDDWLDNTDQNYFQKHQFALKHFPEISPTADIFYANCATGPGVASFARLFPAAAITAGDINPDVCQKCREYLSRHGIFNVRKFVDAPSEYLTPIPNDSFDVVFTHAAIWKIPYRAFTEYCRILRPGGHLIGTATSTHDTTIFFQRYGRMYHFEQNLVCGDALYVSKAKVSKEAKKQLLTDAAVVDVITIKICPEGEDAEVLPECCYRTPNGFPVYQANKNDTLEALKNLGYSGEELSESLRRLFLVARGTFFSPEASYHAIAVQGV